MSKARQIIFTVGSWLAVLGSLALTVFRYSDSLRRLLTAFRDVGLSVAYYFCKLFLGWKEMPFEATVLQLPDVDLQKFISIDLTELARRFKAFGPAFFDQKYFFAYNEWLSVFLRQLTIILMLLFMIIGLMIPVLSSVLFSEQDPSKRNVDTKPLQIFKRLTFKPYITVRSWLSDLRVYLREHFYFAFLCSAIWLVNLNVLTIAIEFIAFYFYFAASFSFLDVPGQILKLLIDLIIMFAGAPLIFWLVAGYVLFNKICLAIGYDKLWHNELKNRGFINTLNICVLISGSMGTGKTTLLTDMAISQAIMFRSIAYEKMQQHRYRLPNFTWANLEYSLSNMIKDGDLKTLASVRRWIGAKRKRFEEDPCAENCFGYDLEHFSKTYDDGLKISDVFNIVETYAQLYFIYTFGSSITVSNYSIREFCEVHDTGHMPQLITELFKCPSVPLEGGRYSKIIDFNILRPGKKVEPYDNNYGSFEFGVLAFSEFGKERGNSKENVGYKKTDETANPLNDKINEFLKMIRHPATVDFTPFCRVFSDEQRPESLGANDRDLFSLIWIAKKSELRLAMPGFFFRDILNDLALSLFKKYDRKSSACRSDNTLLGFIIKNVLSAYLRYSEGIYNTFGYNKLRLEVESGRMDGEAEVHEYYLSSKKVYSKTFSTDCFSEYFAEAILVCNKGLDDLPEYETEKPSAAEHNLQRSHFIRSLNENMKNN